ncbi:MAG TPA: hypothetical protein VFW37_07260 [Alphaproteobacteria bacterium]|nr:hypothetical protein [Alphaproteobacteria bacterium]
MPSLPDMEAIAQRLTALKRFVLLIGDAGALLTRLAGNTVQSHLYFSGTIDENIRQVRLALADEPERPVILLYDVLGQTYRRDRLPPVNFLDRPKIMMRKLETLFPGTELKGGLQLGVSGGEIRGFDYLFASVTALPEIVQWQQMLDQIENPVSDARLLPVEAVRLLNRLVMQANPLGQKPDQWNILISQHRTGGFRQVVTRDGRISIARMTSGFIEIDAAAETGALLRREIGATIDYITRLGFNRDEGLNAIFIGRRSIGDALIRMQLPVRKLTVFSPSEAAQAMGVTGADDGSGHFADLLHSVTAGSRIIPALSIWPRARRQKYQQMVGQRWGARALAAASVAGLIYAGVLGWEIRGAETELAQVEAIRANLQQHYDAEASKLDRGPVSVARMRDVISIHQQLEAGNPDLAPLYAVLRASLSDSARLKLIRVEIAPPPPAILSDPTPEGVPAAAPEPGPVSGKVTLFIDLSSYRDAVLAVGEADRVTGALRKALPEMQINIMRQPLNILPADTFTVKPGENILEFTGKELVAEIEMTGRLK